MTPGGAGGGRLYGVALICLAVAFFACLDTTAKYLAQTLPPLQVVWLRYVTHFLIVLMIWNPIGRPALYRTKRLWLQIIRAALMFGATAFNFVALKYLQLAEANAIFFAAPLLVAAFAGPLLGEWAGPRRWAAILAGFLGVVVVLRPGLGGLHPAFGLSVLGMASYAFYSITTRMLAATDSPQSMLIFSALFPVIALTPIVPFIWQSPEALHLWLLMPLLGAFGAAGHWCLILAHGQTPAPVLAPFTYTQILWMIVLGFLVFGDRPTATTLIGAGIVIASGLYLLARERRSRVKNDAS